LSRVCRGTFFYRVSPPAAQGDRPNSFYSVRKFFTWSAEAALTLWKPPGRKATLKASAPGLPGPERNEAPVPLFMLCLLLSSQASGAGFRAAVVKVPSTPEGPKVLAGYASRKSTGIHDRIYHRVVALEDGGRR
jgi:hypothetical protein